MGRPTAPRLTSPQGLITRIANCHRHNRTVRLRFCAASPRKPTSNRAARRRAGAAPPKHPSTAGAAAAPPFSRAACGLRGFRYPTHELGSWSMSAHGSARRYSPAPARTPARFASASSAPSRPAPALPSSPAPLSPSAVGIVCCTRVRVSAELMVRCDGEIGGGAARRLPHTAAPCRGGTWNQPSSTLLPTPRRARSVGGGGSNAVRSCVPEHASLDRDDIPIDSSRQPSHGRATARARGLTRL